MADQARALALVCAGGVEVGRGREFGPTPPREIVIFCLRFQGVSHRFCISSIIVTYISATDKHE